MKREIICLMGCLMLSSTCFACASMENQPQPEPQKLMVEVQIPPVQSAVVQQPPAEPPVEKKSVAPPSSRLPSAYLDIEEKVAGNAPQVQRTPPCRSSSYKIYHYMPETSKSQGMESRLSDISRDVAGKIFYRLKDDGEKNLTSTVAVVGAVPLSDLKRETEFGRIMAEFLLTDIADRGMKVTELRLGKEINIMAQSGEFILSRNIGELANSSPEVNYVVVSTFTNTRKTLIIQGRLVNLQNGLVKTSWRYTMPLNRELLGLFHTIEQQPFTIAVKGMND
ncbi:MAG: FlgO family outer membrane protein [Thermodesulfobacteriota bacterium]|nr:FlgO family outer membrane protein [Thermodesulfobacteriota bacterium]